MEAKKESNTVSYIDYKSSPEHRPLHCYYLPGTWILDEVYFGKEVYLFCVEGNSRYLYVDYITSNENLDEELKESISKYLRTNIVTQTMDTFLKDIAHVSERSNVRDVKYIIWDDAPIHKSDDMKDFLTNVCRIKTWLINVKRIGHGQLRVLSRTVKTITDLIETYYNKTHSIDSLRKTLETVIIDYNNKSPHATLEKITHIRGMTPWNVHVNEVIERQTIIYCQCWNYNMKMKPHYKIEVGDKVLVKDIETHGFKKKRNTYMNNNQVYTVKEIRNGEYILDPPYIPPDLKKSKGIPVNCSMLVIIRVKEEEY